MEYPTDNPESQDQAAMIEAARQALVAEVDYIPRLFGVDVAMKVGTKWVTDVYPDGRIEVSIDPGWFIKQGYSPEDAEYATMHEVAAHVREAMFEPELTKKVGEFAQQGKAQAIFHNILSDIAGNKFTHARFPRTEARGKHLYETKLFPDDTPPLNDPLNQIPRYQDLPRHIQFLYKIIREEMIPGSHTTVLSEVDEAIAALRDYQGTGQDVIAYSTSVAKPDGTPTKPEERFGLWMTAIYPEFERLLEIDKQDPNFQKSNDPSNEQGDPSDQSQQGEPQQGEPQQGEQDGKPDQPGQRGQNTKPGDGQFKESYDDYWQNKHPEPLSHEDHEKLHEAAKKIAEDKKRKFDPDRKIREAFKNETGHSMHELQTYNGELIARREEIEAIRELFFKRVIEPRVAVKRRLGRNPQTEGALLDPNRLAETVIDIAGGVEEPQAFLDYEHRRAATETVGNTDYYLVIDRSSSMGEGEKAKNAATSTLIFLEGLAGVQKDIEEAEAQYGIELDVAIRSSVYGFGDTSVNLKPLGAELNEKERLDSYQAAKQPLNEGTNDYLALQDIADEPREDEDRRRIIVVFSDGESNNVEQAGLAVRALRNSPNTVVYGISIGSDEAVTLYAPDARRCDDPNDLPGTLEKLLQETLQ